ncbi:sensor histidine kinase [Pontimicrobium aquaticum]|uniref:Histidine kinase n=1 Tax=Pontimicrobium aquaticum TaxID=2565367 RepID=A0A4U0ES74_9FLAO|nr:histidine kinase [Pontimicrobium aquaticum]TJY34583.1 histidine kinase [Pontimicrobium aquaticum]
MSKHKFYILAMMENRLSKNSIRNILFWIIMFLYLLSSYWLREANKRYVLEYIAFKVLLQMLLSVIIINFLVPIFLNKKKKILFIVTTLLAIYLVQTLYSVIRVYYFEVKYAAVYARYLPYILWERMTSFFAFVNNITWLVFPSIILLAIKYYRDQKDIVALKEQKKTTELNLLRNQLNPHFLFNTLNNLYTLALKKSDKTPEVIAKLSEILDYMLYQCKDKYVPIDKEMELLENYIALEKVRYGSRIDVLFEKKINENVKIAPLILLTFVENAFKHGVSQELKNALIEISTVTTTTEIVFKLKNTKPQYFTEKNNPKKRSIGMQNIEKQLDLLYPKAYQLKVKSTALNYALELKLQLNEKI